MPSIQDEKSQPQPHTAATREAEMRAMAQMLARESRKSAIVGFFGGVIVVVGLGATYYAFLQTRSTLKTEIVKTGTLQTEVKTKSAEANTAKQQADATKAVFSATVENLQAASPTVSASTTSAIDEAFDSNPNAANLLVRVYIHSHASDQQTSAVAIANALRAAGYLVPGMDVQPQSYKETEVHYYSDDSQSLSDVDAIIAIVAKTGIPVRKRQVPRAPSDKLRPRAYGLWLAADLQAVTPVPIPAHALN